MDAEQAGVASEPDVAIAALVDATGPAPVSLGTLGAVRIRQPGAALGYRLRPGGQVPACIRRQSRLTTSLIETSPDEPDGRAVATIAEAVRDGEVVAVPSDALYVLVADPFNLNAVAKVFEAKRREIHRSLPLLVDGVPMAEEYAARLSSSFYLLTRRFWPGLLTVIVPASSKVPLRVTGNTGRLALRRSAAPLIGALVAAAGTPLIGTSANVSGRPTCRSGFEVLGTMDGRIRLIADGGPLAGPATTTVDVTPPQWRLIKRGGVSPDAIADCLGW